MQTKKDDLRDQEPNSTESSLFSFIAPSAEESWTPSCQSCQSCGCGLLTGFLPLLWVTCQRLRPACPVRSRERFLVFKLYVNISSYLLLPPWLAFFAFSNFRKWIMTFQLETQFWKEQYFSQNYQVCGNNCDSSYIKMVVEFCNLLPEICYVALLSTCHFLICIISPPL